MRRVLALLQQIFTGHAGLLSDSAAHLPYWQRALTPAIGGLLAALVLLAARRALQFRAFAEYIEAVRFRAGVVPFIPTAWRVSSSAISIATGASIGREGSMIQLASSAVSALGERFEGRRLSLKHLVACGAAGAVGAVYQAPVAAVFFALEIVLGCHPLTWSAIEIAPALGAAAVTGFLTNRWLLAGGPLFPAAISLHLRVAECLPLLVLSVSLGVLGPAYYWLIRSCVFLRRLPVAMVWGGAVVGLLSCVDPAVWGNGDTGLLSVMHGGVALKSISVLLCLRLAATTASIGSGMMGGVFTPTLFAGSVCGLLYGNWLAGMFPGGVQPELYAVAGLACLLAAATHAPLMSACMAVELTGRLPLFPALLACSLLSSYVAQKLQPQSLYAVATPEPARFVEPIAGSSAASAGRRG